MLFVRQNIQKVERWVKVYYVNFYETGKEGTVGLTMQEREYRAFCQDHGLNDEDLQAALDSVKQFEAFLKEKKKSLDEMTIIDVKEYISDLTVQGKNTWEYLAEEQFCPLSHRDSENLLEKMLPKKYSEI